MVQASGQTMNTVFATAASACATYVHTIVYVYNAPLYVYCTLCMRMFMRKKCLFQDHKTKILITKRALKHGTKQVKYRKIFGNELFLTVAVLLLSVGLPVANAPDVLQPCGLLYYP